MRAAKRILLICMDSEELSVLSYTFRNIRLNNNEAYCDIAETESIEEALLLLECEYDLLLCYMPLFNMEKLLDHAKKNHPYMRTMLITKTATDLEKYVVDAAYCRPSMTEVVEHLRVITQRKRGPRKGWKKALQEVVHA
jgi:hypothetical protein